jgi:predicted ester cyclase
MATLERREKLNSRTAHRAAAYGILDFNFSLRCRQPCNVRTTGRLKAAIITRPRVREGNSRVSTTATDLVSRFYDVVWNQADEAEARVILAADFRFHGSLGLELRGPGGFIAYLRAVHAALENFICTVEDMVSTADRAACRVRFTGKHRGKFFGAAPTGRDIRWAGAAFFATSGGKITELWVLGDIDAVKRQIMPQHPAESFKV